MLVKTDLRKIRILKSQDIVCTFVFWKKSHGCYYNYFYHYYHYYNTYFMYLYHFEIIGKSPTNLKVKDPVDSLILEEMVRIGSVVRAALLCHPDNQREALHESILLLVFKLWPVALDGEIQEAEGR